MTPPNLLKLISKFSKSIGHKVNKNSGLILCTNNKLFKKEIKNKYPIYNSITGIEYLGIKLTKEQKE